jgi:hypothetical protein
MKILFVSDAAGPDYQGNALFHGLRSLLGPQVVDVGKLSFMYTQKQSDLSKLYGRGFSLYGTLENCEVDREDITRKIEKHFFDLIIFGAATRRLDYLMEALEHYAADELIFIDGEDGQALPMPFINRGIVFKRELAEPQPGVFPIHFGIPKEKILSAPPEKNRILAHIDPRDRSTYIYETEKDYYQGYAESLFGITTVKAGWDCMRHYEILANRCIPYFVELEKCPVSTLHRLPKLELIYMRGIQNRFGDEDFWTTEKGKNLYTQYEQIIHDRFLRYHTTEAVAKYVLDVQRTLKNQGTSSDPAFLFTEPVDSLNWKAA